MYRLSRGHICLRYLFIPLLLSWLTVYAKTGVSLESFNEANESTPHQQLPTETPPNSPQTEIPPQPPKNDDAMFCAILNPSTGSYVDLSQLSSAPNREVSKDRDRNDNQQSHEQPISWPARGWQFGVNFTLGICSSPVADSNLSNTTGAYYNSPSGPVSIGEYSTVPVYTGKKLTLTYTNGDSCPNGVDRKSSLLHFICDKEIQTKAQVSFIGSLNNCSYFFEVRSIHACPTSHKKNDINVLGIFIGILLVFFAVEYGRRWFYKRLRHHRLLKSTPHDYLAMPDTARPRWAAVESEPRWKTFLRSFFTYSAEPHTLIKLTAATSPGNTAPNHLDPAAPYHVGGVSLRDTQQSTVKSTVSLYRDMEAQNNLLDSLEVHSSEVHSTDG